MEVAGTGTGAGSGDVGDDFGGEVSRALRLLKGRGGGDDDVLVGFREEGA